MTRLSQELERAEKKAKSRKLFMLLLILSCLIGILGGLTTWIIYDLPRIKSLEAYPTIESSIVYSSNGKVIAEFYLERRTFIPHYRIPENVKKAFISVEDIRFYYHPGVDIIGIGRALWHDIKAKSIVEGGSTITQQLARMLFLTPERSIKRKLKEAALSVQIEKHYTKDEILGLYLNQAYFGTRAYGIEAASQTYFGKSVEQLTLGEAALLASLPRAPSLYSPFKNPEKAKERRTIVLKKMLSHRFISTQAFEQAEQESLPLSPHMRKYEAPYFIEFIRQGFEQKYGSKIYTSGYKIYSTLDHEIQKRAEESVRKGIETIEKRVTPGVQASLVAIELRTGRIIALVGGSDFWKNQYNRAVQAKRQPGSGFKPFVYLTAFENGMLPEDKIVDSPISFRGSRGGEVWSPENYDKKYYGAVTLRTALAKSLNTATVKLAHKLGMNTIIQTVHRLGIRGDIQPFLSSALGASEVTLLEITSAYAAFATGKHIEPYAYERILNRDGGIIEEILPEVKVVMDEDVTNKMMQVLQSVVREGTAYRAREVGRPVYGKTGTTNNYTDAWFIGFDERIAAGVWVGRDNNMPIGRGETGARAALPIWVDFMKRVPLQIPQDQNP